jgi:hypothetical protein
MQPPAQTPHVASKSLFTACGLDFGRLCSQRQYDIPSLLVCCYYSSLSYYPVLHIDFPRETLSSYFAGAAVILFCILQQTTDRAGRRSIWSHYGIVGRRLNALLKRWLATELHPANKQTSAKDKLSRICARTTFIVLSTLLLNLIPPTTGKITNYE